MSLLLKYCWRSLLSFFLQMVRIIILYLFFSDVFLLSAQERLLPVFHFDPLSAASAPVPLGIRARVIRDNTGFIWIGAEDGLYRYDGYNFKRYDNKPDDPYSLSSNLVKVIFIDSDQRLWVGTDATGLSLYDRNHEHFINFLPRLADSSWYQAKRIYSIIEDRSGNLWLGTTQGLVKVEIPAGPLSTELDSLVKNIHFQTCPLGTPLNSARDLLEQEDGRIMVASDSGLLIFDPELLDFSRLHLQGPAGHLIDTVLVNCIFRDSHGTFWLGTETDGVFRLDPNSQQIINYRHKKTDNFSISSDMVWQIAEDLSGKLWISTKDGPDLFSPVTGQRIPYRIYHPPLPGYKWLSVDKTGIVWLGTGGDGVLRLTPKSRLFPHYAYQLKDGGLAGFGTIEPGWDGTYWFSLWSAILNVDVFKLKAMKMIDVWKGERPLKDIPHPRYTLIDKNRNFWYCSYGLGLFQINLDTGKIRRYTTRTRFGQDNMVTRITQDSRGNFWVASGYDGLLRFDPSSGRFQKVPGLSVSKVSDIVEDSDGKIWIATEDNGVVLHDPKTNHNERFVNNPADPRSLSDDRTINVYHDPSGRIWIGAMGNMINLWDPATRSFTRYLNKAIPIANWAVPMCMDKNGRIWITYYGFLSVFDPSDGEFNTFDYSNGIAEPINDMENLPDGRILMSGVWAGIYIFDPDSIKTQRSAPPLTITGMSINDLSVVPPELTKGLQLSYTQNVLEFEFSAIDIDAPQLVQYQYQLEGLEKDWVKPEDRRYVRYPGLDPGNYVFRVRATSIRNEWPEQEISLAISIAPPWYRTFWAYGSYLLVFIGILFAGYRMRLRQIHLKQQMAMEHFQAKHLAEVDKLKSRFFANISHEFRTPLTLILGPVEQVISSTRNSSTAQKMRLVRDSARKLLNLVNQLLDFSRVESGMMHLKVSDGELVPFLRRVVMSFESWAERKRINLEFKSDPASIQGYFDGDKLEKILNNLLSNALKFTPEGGRVDVSLRVRQLHDGRSNLKTSGEIASSSVSRRTPRNDWFQEGLVEISVMDTGIGIAPQHLPHIFARFYRVDETHSTEGTGIGLALTHELVQLHHGTITAESTPGKGSVFTLQLPIGKSAYTSDEIVEIVPPSNIAGPGRLEEVVKEIKSVEEITPVKEKKAAEGKPIVLVVEDNADLRQYICENLEPEYAAIEAADGKKGFDQAAEVVPDLVISDIMMPEMDGIELCSTLKKDIRTSHIPVILLTARSGIESKLKGLETGADDYVTKPFDARELLARVKNLIEQRQLLRKKFSAKVLLKPGEIAITSLDNALLKRVMETVEKRMGSENFSVEELAQEVFLSRRHLDRKLHALTNLSTADFIRHMRLQRAYELLEKQTGSVAEISYLVGFGSPSYFSFCFREHFGFPPTEIPHQKG